MEINKTKKVDRRILRTKKLLSAALLGLMQEKPFDEVTIKEIAERADVNRATFYLHYGTKEELLFSSLQSRFDQLVQTIEADIHDNPDEPIWSDERYDQLVFEHVAEHVDLYKVILDQNGMGMIIHQIIDYIANVAERNTAAYYSNGQEFKIPLDITSRFVAGAMFSLIVWWVRNDLPHTPAEMAQMCHQLVSLGCNDLLIEEAND